MPRPSPRPPPLGQLVRGNLPRRPEPSSAAVSRRMSKQRRRDTNPEVALRRELHRLGLRFRLDRKVLESSRTRVDILLPGARLAVFVDGCFWHRCPDHGSIPESNRDWWAAKLARNV